MSGLVLPITASFERMGHHQSVSSAGLFCRYYFGRCSFQLTELVPPPPSCRRSIFYSNRFHKDVYDNSFFPCPARLWNSLPIECFHLTYDLNGFKSKLIDNIFSLGYF